MAHEALKAELEERLASLQSRLASIKEDVTRSHSGVRTAAVIQHPVHTGRHRAQRMGDPGVVEILVTPLESHDMGEGHRRAAPFRWKSECVDPSGFDGRPAPAAFNLSDPSRRPGDNADSARSAVSARCR